MTQRHEQVGVQVDRRVDTGLEASLEGVAPVLVGPPRLEVEAGRAPEPAEVLDDAGQLAAHDGDLEGAHRCSRSSPSRM